jgi:hypothetical protein
MVGRLRPHPNQSSDKRFLSDEITSRASDLSHLDEPHHQRRRFPGFSPLFNDNLPHLTLRKLWITTATTSTTLIISPLVFC